MLLLVFGPRLRRSTLRGHVLALILAGTPMAGYALCWFLGIARMGAAVPTLIALCLPPVLVTVVAIARGRDRLDSSLVAALAAALTGTGLVILPHGGLAAAEAGASLSAGVAFSVASAVLYAGFTMVSGRLSKAQGAGPATTCLTLVAALAMATFGLGGLLLMFSLWVLARRTTRRAADGPAPGLTAPCRD